MKNNQLRKHLKFENVHKKRLAHHKKILGNCGDNVFLTKTLKSCVFLKIFLLGIT